MTGKVHRRVKEPEGLAAHLERTRADLLTEARETVADRAGGRVNERWLDEDGEAIRQHDPLPTVCDRPAASGSQPADRPGVQRAGGT